MFTHSRERNEQVATERGQREKEDSQAKKQQLAERERLRAEQRKRREAVSRVQSLLESSRSDLFFSAVLSDACIHRHTHTHTHRWPLK